ncbi:MAG: hypothetical protein NZ700_07480 [Gemmataceae bacterium]|nr:hypothetical protein [Gemmataceae bacterium]MDW8266005.1 hypothetical protein [Gemmataceae bacterium]
MRLTLRTLLAYLDDTLEPAQAAVIGQKVAESETAQKLIERIKAVLHDRQLTVPPATGPEAKIDANTVAEYLDNELPSDKLADVEEICLNSDVHLAEVAACHQILTLFLGEPIQVPPTAYERMSRLAPERRVRRRPRRKKPVVERGPDELHHDDEDETLRLGLPLFQLGGSGFRRWVPLLVVVVLVAALGVAIWQAFPDIEPVRVARQEGTSQATGPSGGEPSGPGARPPVAEPPAGPPAQPPVAEPPKPEPPPPSEPMPMPQPMPPKRPLDKVPTNEPNPQRRQLGQLAAGRGSALFRRGPEANSWERVAPDAEVASAEELISLPGFRSELRLDSGVRLVLWGNVDEFTSMQALREGRELPVRECALTLHAPGPGFDLDFTLHRGRVVLRNAKADGGAVIRLRFADEIWDVTLGDQRSEASAELAGLYLDDMPFHADGRGEGPAILCGLFALAGEVQLKVRYQTMALPPASLVTWNNIGAGMLGPYPMTKPPEWWLEPEQAEAPEAKRMRLAIGTLAKRLGQPVRPLLVGMLREPESAPRRLAVACLVALDDVLPVVDGLASPQADVRDSAVAGLRHWISRAPRLDVRLYRLLQEQRGFGRAQAEITLHLLHNFSRDDRAKPETYETLIAYLQHDRPAIRTLAHWHLVRLAPQGRTIAYDPTAPAAQLEKAVLAWKKLIPDGAVPPAPMPEAPP